MQAGKLRHRVTVQRMTETRDDFGGVVSAWVDVQTVWGEVQPLEGRELQRAAQVFAEVTHSVTLRYVGEITPKQQLLHRGRTLSILSVVNRDERRYMLTIMCKELV